jgi:hypothetical protein
VNGDNTLNISDAIYLVAHLFQGGPAPESCPGGGPGAETACRDGVDNDVDGATDCDDWDCSNSDLDCTPLSLAGFTYQGENLQGYHEWDHDRTGIRMVSLPGGSFNMGAQREDLAGPNYDENAGWNGAGPQPMPGDDINESPVHRVTLSPFLIGKFEVTEDEYELIVGGESPSVHVGGNPSGGFDTVGPPPRRPRQSPRTSPAHASYGSSVGVRLPCRPAFGALLGEWLSG